MTAILLIAALAASIWMVAVLLRGGLLAGALLILFTGTCANAYLYRVPTGFIPFTIDRILFLVVLAQCAVYRRFGRTTPRPFGKAEVVLAAFLGLLVFSTLSHDWTFQGNLPASRLLFYYLMPAGTYWVARQLPLSEVATRRVFGFLAVLGLYLAATGVAEWLRLRDLVFPHYISSPEFPEFLGRARGPLLNPAANGYFVAIGLCATWMWWPRLATVGRALLLACTGLFVAGTYATLTRCVWLGGLTMTMVVAAFVLPRNWRAPVIAATILLAGVVVATQWERLLQFKRDEGQSSRVAADSAKLRPVLAIVAWRMFLERPVFGCGFGHYREKFVEVLDDRSSDFPLDASRPFVQHNVFLGLLTETGLAGTGLYIMLLGYWFKDAWNVWRAQGPLWQRQLGLLFLATFASYLSNGMFQDLAIIPIVNTMLFFLAGLTRAAAADARV